MAQVMKGQLNDAEKKMLDAILKGSSQEVASLLKEPGVRIDCLDETGMTPLQHAAFKGRADVCRLFLDHGANVNANYHENSYSTLHFAALSGNVEVVNLVLEAGAKIDWTNSVNRTAAQMAAFVGQHQCVRAITNFFPKEELEQFTIAKGFEKEPKLPPNLLLPLLKLINSTNLNPVKVAMYLGEHIQLMLESYKVCKVLDILVERNMKSKETNDVQAIKMHYFAAIIRQANKALKNSQDNLNAFIKSLVKGRDQDGFQELQDRLVRQALKDFPYPESQLLQTLVRQIAPIKIGEGSALSVLISGLYGPSFDDETACTACGETKAEKKCSACKVTNYCNQNCQKLHWPTHKKLCQKIAEEFKQRELERLKAEQRRKEEEDIERKMADVNLAGVAATESDSTGIAATESDSTGIAATESDSKEEIQQMEKGDSQVTEGLHQTEKEVVAI